MDQHVLDNPVWHALISGNSALAKGTDKARFFPEEISPIAGVEAFSSAHFTLLHELVTTKKPLVIFSLLENPPLPNYWNLLQSFSGYQMVYSAPSPPAESEEQPAIRLTTKHIADMLALTKLTNPGPFLSRTIEFGNYEGIFEDNDLIAMAGHRLRPSPYVEISAVCTHPNHTGKGLAKQLLLRQVRQIIDAGEIPFLHVRDDNKRAVDIYRNLGFEVRTPINFYVLEKRKH